MGFPIHCRHSSRKLTRSLSCTIVSFLPLVSRHIIRPSIVHVDLTPSTVRAFRNNSIRCFVKFSVITSRVPFSLRFAPKIDHLASYDFSFTIIGRGFPFELPLLCLWPRRWLRSMQSLVSGRPSFPLHTDRTALSESVCSSETPCNRRQFRRLCYITYYSAGPIFKYLMILLVIILYAFE